jgi:RimJ/RimL family protein N-acetyltransferase
MFEEDAPYHTPRLQISHPEESVRLQELGLMNAEALRKAAAYDYEHLRKFTPSVVEEYRSLSAALSSIARHDSRKIQLGIWDQGTLRGSIELMPWMNESEVAYWVGAEHTGHHYAARAARLLARWAFQAFPFTDSLFTRVAHDNIASQKTSLSAGFQRTDEDDRWIYFTKERPASETE